jgi:hypothetical protein
MSMLSEEVNAVLAAPIPFVTAVGASVAAIWGVMEWFYRSGRNKRKELHELSRLDVERWKDQAEQTTEDAAKQIEQLRAELDKEKHLSTEAKAQLDQLKASTSKLTVQLTALGQANSGSTSGMAAGRGGAPGRGQQLAQP